MKNKLTTIPILNLSIILLLIVATTSCNNRTNQDDTKEIAEDKNDEKFETNKSEYDAQFLVNVAEINLKEIALGRLAVQKANMKDVKDLGQMMIDEHTKALADLKTLASNKAISIPETLTENGMEDEKKLLRETGKDFDMDYSKMMVDEHQDAIKKFEKASADALDPEIKEMATNMLPALRKHLEQANACHDKVKENSK